jgi:uncharacterized protein YjiS (DUF1127 family)
MSTQLVRGSTALLDSYGGIDTSHGAGRIPGWIAGLSATIRRWTARSRQRKALGDLAALNHHLLQDIGVSRDEALLEAAKWFWQSGR